MLCRYMTFALVAVIEKMNIVQMVLVVTGPIALVPDIKQHSCNMARAHNIIISKSDDFSLLFIEFYFF